MLKQNNLSRCVLLLSIIITTTILASGYVQGINDLATPFLVVFLADSLHVNCFQTFFFLLLHYYCLHNVLSWPLNFPTLIDLVWFSHCVCASDYCWRRSRTARSGKLPLSLYLSISLSLSLSVSVSVSLSLSRLWVASHNRRCRDCSQRAFQIEADVYWSFSRLLDGIQVNQLWAVYKKIKSNQITTTFSRIIILLLNRAFK